ncbi:low-density lipoprotein receptor-related protein 6-like [Glandiceps talaboti]
MTFDIDDSLLFWCNQIDQAIMKMDLKTNDVTKLYDGVSDGLADLAVDWVANNVYWSDRYYNWIMMSDYNGNFHHVVVNTELGEPSGIAVDPMNSKLYWVDYDGNARIESVTLTGENRTLLASENDGIAIPYALTLDYDNRRLYWTDLYHEAMYSLDVDAAPGQMDIKLEYGGRGLYYPFFMNLNEDYFFISEYEYDYIMILPRDNATYDNAALLHVYPSTPFAIAFYDVTRQPPHDNMCAVDNGGCDQLCISTPDINIDHCLCTAGYVMDSNGTCVEDRHLIPGHKLLIAYPEGICSTPVNLADVQNLSGVLNCFLYATISHFDYDFQQEMLYVYMPSDAAIKRVRVRENEAFEIVHSDVRNVGGIAVDWISATLYWTETTNNKIMISRLDGLYKSIIADVDNPLAIGVHPLREYLFWIVGGPNPWIERSTLSGGHRVKLVTVDIVQPVAMAIDYDNDRIYWADEGTLKLESVATDGNERTLVITEAHTQVTFGGVAVYQDLVMWTKKDIDDNHLVFYETGTPTISRIFDFPYDLGAIKVYDERMQPRLNAINPCIYATCSGICVPNKGNEDCICEIDNLNCTRVVSCPSNFLHGSIPIDCDNTEGMNCSYTCDKGFHAIDTGQLVCTDTGAWDRDVDTLCNFGFGTGSRLIYTDSYTPLFAPLSDLGIIDQTTESLYQSLQSDGDTKYVKLHGGFNEYKSVLTYDIDDGFIFWGDVDNKAIVKMDLKTDDVTILYDGVSEGLGDLAVDWVANNVYWSDSSYNWIMMSDYNGRFHHVVVNTGLSEPFGIVVDPMKSKIYWADWNGNGRIESATLLGENRTILAGGNDDFGSARGITLDFENRRLYWIDSNSGAMNSIDVDADPDEMVIRLEYAGDGLFYPSFMDLDKNYYFINEYIFGYIMILPRDSATFENAVFYTRDEYLWTPLSLAIHDVTRQPPHDNMCAVDNGGCDQLCISTPDINSDHCLCTAGYVMDSNSSCVE